MYDENVRLTAGGLNQWTGNIWNRSKMFGENFSFMGANLNQLGEVPVQLHTAPSG